MDSDMGKLFIGGISWETTEERLKEYFSNYGEVTETVIMKDRVTGRARGFGFVVFADPTVADQVLLEKHTIDGRTVEAKRAVPRDEQQTAPISIGGGPVAAGSIRTKKIFVGGLASTLSEEDFKKYFEQFGTITDVVVMRDQATQRPRGFGFITFDSEDAVDSVLQKSFHELNDKLVEVKRAIPKELQPPSWARSPGGPVGGAAPRGSPFGSGYGQGYSTSAAGFGGRYGLGPDGRGVYPTYGGSGYGSAGYMSGGGYGAGMNGSYGVSSYGGAVGYGSGASYGGGGFGSAPYAAGAAGYGTLDSARSGGFGSGSGRNAWGSGGYGSLESNAGYGGGGGGYGSSGGWASGSGGAGQAAGSTGGYGYAGNPSSATGSYGGRGAGYGSGVRGFNGQSDTTGSGAYGASSYDDGYVSSAYPDTTWRSMSTEPYGAVSGPTTGYGGALSASDTSAAGYGGGYGESGWHSRASDARYKSYPASGDRTSY